MLMYSCPFNSTQWKEWIILKLTYCWQGWFTPHLIGFRWSSPWAGVGIPDGSLRIVWKIMWPNCWAFLLSMVYADWYYQVTTTDANCANLQATSTLLIKASNLALGNRACGSSQYITVPCQASNEYYFTAFCSAAAPLDLAATMSANQPYAVEISASTLQKALVYVYCNWPVQAHFCIENSTFPTTIIQQNHTIAMVVTKSDLDVSCP